MDELKDERFSGITGLVVLLAAHYHAKMRKPNIYDIDDLVSEGMLIVVSQLPKDGVVTPYIKSYTLKSVKNRFKALLHDTFKRKNNYHHNIPEQSTGPNTLQIDVLDQLSCEQKTYIAQVIDIRPGTTLETYKKMIRKIRERLGICYADELRIRRSLLALTKEQR